MNDIRTRHGAVLPGQPVRYDDGGGACGVDARTPPADRISRSPACRRCTGADLHGDGHRRPARWRGFVYNIVVDPRACGRRRAAEHGRDPRNWNPATGGSLLADPPGRPLLTMRARGFTLVELLIGMAIAAMLMLLARAHLLRVHAQYPNPQHRRLDRERHPSGTDRGDPPQPERGVRRQSRDRLGDPRSDHAADPANRAVQRKRRPVRRSTRIPPAPTSSPTRDRASSQRRPIRTTARHRDDIDRASRTPSCCHRATFA